MSEALQTKPRIIVAADHQLVNKEFYTEQVWKPGREAAKAFNGRSAWRFALTLVDDYAGQLYQSDGSRYFHDEIPDIFPDVTMRWIDYFLAADASGEKPKSYSRQFERLRIIELYCRLVSAKESAVEKLPL